MKTVVIIQQRLNSTHLPRKALLPLCGKSMTWHIIERCKRAKLVDEVMVAVPFGQDANEIGSTVECVILFPGFDILENDLIGRYYWAAKLIKADFIVRVSGDNPCVEPEEIDHLVANIGAYGDWRLLMNSESYYRDHDGFGGEVFSLEMLEWMDRSLKEPEYREHPHKFWIKLNAFDYCGRNYPVGFRLDVNNQKDYEKIRDIYEALYPANPNFSIRDVIRYLNAKKEAS